MEIIQINISKSYTIRLENNILEEIPSIFVTQFYKVDFVIIICDLKLKDLYDIPLINSFNRLGITTKVVYVESTENNKSIHTAVSTCEEILNNHTISRKTPIFSLGGGIIGDLTGFCASILLRGLPYFQIPTTLLSQVDSSIGGKTGVNTSFIKNSIGSFYQPSYVFIDTNVLSSLSNRDFISGYAECLKYALLYDKNYFHFLIQNEQLLLQKDENLLKTIIRKSLLFKKLAVEQDEKETKDIRILLNLGHSFAHAFEAYNNYQENLTHGEAVAIGMLWAIKYSQYNNLITDETIYSTVYNHLQYVNLPCKISQIIKNIDPQNLLNLMLKDKKNTNDNISLVLLHDIGDAFVCRSIQKNNLLEFILYYLNNYECSQ